MFVRGLFDIKRFILILSIVLSILYGIVFVKDVPLAGINRKLYILCIYILY